jgi:hypothetical protein
LVEVQKRELFELVGYGFSLESLLKMSIEERRLHFHLLVEKNKPRDQKNQPPPGKLKPNMNSK